MTPTRLLLAALITAPSALHAQADADRGWYVTPTLSLSQLSDQSATTNAIGGLDGQADVALSTGFASGLSLGFSYDSNWSAELAWEYRSNDSSVTLRDGQRFDDGNYASNVFFINGLYQFDSNNRWRPYAGLGLGWIQEIDIDLETAGEELSYSGDGETGFQGFAGLDYELGSRWSLRGELRYTSFTDLKLSAEEGIGSFSGLDYTPLSFQLGLKFKF